MTESTYIALAKRDHQALFGEEMTPKLEHVMRAIWRLWCDEPIPKWRMN